MKENLKAIMSVKDDGVPRRIPYLLTIVPAEREEEVLNLHLHGRKEGDVVSRDLDELINREDSVFDQFATLASLNFKDGVDKDGDSLLQIEIDGDWKHDHAFFDYLVKTVFGFECVEEEVIEETGSDWYASVHTYQITDDVLKEEAVKLAKKMVERLGLTPEIVMAYRKDGTIFKSVQDNNLYEGQTVRLDEKEAEEIKAFEEQYRFCVCHVAQPEVKHAGWRYYFGVDYDAEFGCMEEADLMSRDFEKDDRDGALFAYLDIGSGEPERLYVSVRNVNGGLEVIEQTEAPKKREGFLEFVEVDFPGFNRGGGDAT